MQAGDLKHRIEIQRLQKTVGADYTTKNSYVTLKRVWAKVNELYGKEWWDAKEYGAEDTVEFTIRYFPGLTVKDRILFRGQLYNILSLDNPLFRNEWWKIRASTDAAHGGGVDG